MQLPAWLSRRCNIVTMGVQGVVRDDEGRVLLVRHGYRPGWHFPGGGLERGETTTDALTRELHEEVGVEPLERPVLWGIYSHFDVFPGDHILLFVVQSWQRLRVPERSYEIQEQGFFELDDLPSDVSPKTRYRLLEIEGLAPRSAAW